MWSLRELHCFGSVRAEGAEVKWKVLLSLGEFALYCS